MLAVGASSVLAFCDALGGLTVCATAGITHSSTTAAAAILIRFWETSPIRTILPAAPANFKFSPRRLGVPSYRAASPRDRVGDGTHYTDSMPLPPQPHSDEPRSIAVLGYGSCALAGTCWGTGFYFGKIALTELNVGHMVLYRFLFACLGLLPLLRPVRFSRKDWFLVLLTAFLGIPLQFMVQFYGLSLTTVSHASLMVGTMPVILAVGATIFTHE